MKRLANSPRQPRGASVALGLVFSLVLASMFLSVSVFRALPAVAAENPSGGLEFISLSTWVEPNDEVVLRLDLVDVPSDHTLTVNLYGRLPMRARVASTIEGKNLGRVVRQVANSSVDQLTTNTNGQVEIGFGIRSGVGDPADTLITKEGVYPLQVTLTDPAGNVAESFVVHFVRLPNDEVKPLSVVLVQPLLFDPQLGPNSEFVPNTTNQNRLGQLLEVYLENLDLPITFQITPETLVSLRGSTDPRDDELFKSLERVLQENVVAAATFVEVDVDGLVKGRLHDLVGNQLALGTSTLVTQLGINAEGSTWIANSELKSEGLNELAKRGVSRLVVPSTSLVGEKPEILAQPFDLATPSGGRLPALATDEVLQSYFQDDTPAALAAAHFTADLAAIWFERPAYSRAVAVMLPGEVGQVPLLRELLPQIQGTPILQPTSMRGALEAADPAATDGIDAKVENPEDRLVLHLQESDTSSTFNGFSGVLAQTQNYLESHSQVFGQGALSRLHEEQQIATSMAKVFSPAQRQAYLDALVEDAATHLGLLQLPDSGAVTLASRDGVIPLSIFNYSGQPASVTLVLESDKLIFQDGNTMSLMLEDEVTALEIPVRARASGAFPMQVWLTTPDGEVTLGSLRYSVRSTAVSGVGVAIAVAALMVIGLWWRKTTVKARRATSA